MKELIKNNAIWVFVALELVFFSIFADSFLTVGNFTSLLLQASTIGLIALGMTVVMINGNIDLAVGATLAMSAVICIDVMSITGDFMGDWSILPAVAAGLLTGVVLGAVQGFVVWKTGVDSFIVTLAGMIGIRGLVFVYTQEDTLTEFNWTFIGFSEGVLLGLPYLAILLLASTLVMHLLLTRTRHGRDVYAVGGNREAAVNAGIRVGPHMMYNFILVGFFAALAGIALATQSGSAEPTSGTLYELWVITAVVLGGTKLTGGAGSIIGTLGGVLAIAFLRKGMNLMGADTETVNLVIGGILIAVLYLDKQLTRLGPGELRL